MPMFMHRQLKTRSKTLNNRRHALWRLTGCILMLCAGSGAALYGQDAPATEEAPAAAENGSKPPKVSLAFSDMDPKQVFLILSEQFLVQFEGHDTVEQPITLVSREGETVDLRGMLALLNAALSKENLEAQEEGQIIRIVPTRIEAGGEWIELKQATTPEEVNRIVEFLVELYLPKEGEADPARHADAIKAHPGNLPRIMVLGTPDVVEQIKQIVTDELDRVAPPPETLPVPPEDPMIKKYFALDYMDAEEFEKLLKDDESLAEPFVSVVAPNNTLAISTRAPAMFDRIDEMITTFDVDRMEVRYLRLSNADPKEVAELLKAIYPAEAAPLPEEVQRLRRERLGEGADDEEVLRGVTRELLDEAGVPDLTIQDMLSQSLSVVAYGELTIVPYAPQNALLVRTFSRNFPKILELIEQLDRPRDQVLIDVYITEVNLDDTTEFGVDFTFRDNMEYRNREYSITQDVGPQLGTLGLSYDLVSDNINAFINALKETDKLDLITRPQVLTKDNTEAIIELGRLVPMVQETKVTPEGASTSSVKYDPVVTKLTVTPQIHPNEYVSLKITQIIDDISAETFQISENFNPQVIIKRTATTELRVKDGQTVCLGGFISDKMLENTTAVPFLSDIPILGYLFKFTSHNKVKQELIIFITPHIITTPTEMLRMTNAQRGLSNASVNGDRDPQILGEQEQLRWPPYRDLDRKMPAEIKSNDQKILEPESE